MSDMAQGTIGDSCGLSITLPRFATGSFEDFLKTFEVFAMGFGWSDTEKSRKMPLCLDGEALNQLLSSEVILMKPSTEKYSLLKDYLLEIYPASNPVPKGLKEFQEAMPNTDESLTDFARRLGRIATKAYPTCSKEDKGLIVLHKFRGCLPKELLAGLISSETTHPVKYAEKAEELRKLVVMDTFVSNEGKSIKFCQKCGLKGHKAEVCKGLVKCKKMWKERSSPENL